MNDAAASMKIAILALPETSASVVFGMYDLFLSAGRDWGIVVDGHPGPQLIQPLLTSAQPAPFVCASGIRLEPQATLEECSNADVICVPELAIPPDESLEGRFTDELIWLRSCYKNGATLATACSGAMLLAEAGLLDGCEATTHWAYCDVLQQRYPTITVYPQRALVVSGEGGRLVMAGGGTSWLDLALYLIARFVNVDTAMQVARINLIDWHNIGQQPFARLARSRQVEDAAIARSQTWIAEHYHERSPVSAMVQLSALAERSFKRRFHQVTGMSPLAYVHALRLEEAKQMLETGDEPIETIAMEVGYEDAGFFSRLFKRKVNLTPAQYRKRFGSMRRALRTGTLIKEA
jgi:transcriptional regulator GlxA family with amidase domain